MLTPYSSVHLHLSSSTSSLSIFLLLSATHPQLLLFEYADDPAILIRHTDDSYPLLNLLLHSPTNEVENLVSRNEAFFGCSKCVSISSMFDSSIQKQQEKSQKHFLKTSKTSSFNTFKKKNRQKFFSWCCNRTLFLRLFSRSASLDLVSIFLSLLSHPSSSTFAKSRSLVAFNFLRNNSPPSSPNFHTQRTFSPSICTSQREICGTLSSTE